MLATVLFALAVICWGLGWANVSFTANGKPYSPNWISGGLMFAGLGLWLAPLF
jgi:hypothetical protein